MLIKYRNGGRTASVTTEEGLALISKGLADEVTVGPPAPKRENALSKRKKEKR